MNILNTFQDKKCVITGGTGLIGRKLVDILINRAKANVYVLSLDDIQPVDGAKYIKVDLCNYDEVISLFNTIGDIDYVFHLAGIKGSIEVTKSRPATFFVPYLKFNTNVLEAARLCKTLKGLVYTSSIGAYSSAEVFVEGQNEDGVPMDTYPGWAKRMAELQIRAYREEYGLNNFHIVRPCNVYGPGDNFDPNNAMVIPSLMYKVNEYLKNPKNPIEIWGDGSAIRDFAYSGDVAYGIIQAMYYGTYSKERNTNYINLGSGVGISIKQLVETLHEVVYNITGQKFEYTFDTTKPSGFPKRIMDISLARELIHYDPDVSLQDGLALMWHWFQENEKEYLKKKNYFTEKK